MKIEVSNGEVVDKYTILKIKSERISDVDKLKFVNEELQTLNRSVIYFLHLDKSLQEYIDQLYEINKILWDTEDSIRKKEHLQQFDNEFIALARRVYFTNDKRAKVKAIINERTNSDFREVKQYSEYH